MLLNAGKPTCTSSVVHFLYVDKILSLLRFQHHGMKINNSGCSCGVFFFLSGMLNIGAGATHVENFLTALNIPCLSSKSIHRLENNIGEKVIEAAEKSCNCIEALEEEKLAQESGKYLNCYLVYLLPIQ